MRKIFIFILSILLIISFSACDKETKKNPRYQPMTKWESENISLYIADSNYGFIEIVQNNEIETLYFSFALYNRLIIKPIKDYYPTENSCSTVIEKWKLKHMKKDSFTAEVESTTYFEEGQELKFKKVADNIDESEIPYPPEQEDEQ